MAEEYPVMASFARPNGETLNFYRYAQADTWKGFGQGVNSSEAWSIAINLKMNLTNYQNALTADELCVIKGSLYEKFESLGIPIGMIQPLVTAFQYVREAQEKLADKEVEAELDKQRSARRKRNY